MSRSKQRLQACRAITLVVAALTASAPVLHSQDMRAVKEPALPPVCATLKSTLTVATATSGQIEQRANTSGSGAGALDTTRIQQALNSCDKGKALELVADAGNTAFLTGPILLRAGVTLLIDKGVILYASRNPEYFAISPGSCGVVNTESSNGCRPLISVKSATGSGIMGDGAIDGQGGAALVIGGVSSAKSWWDIAEDAHTAGRQQAPRMIDADLSDEFTLYRITLKNAPFTHVSFHRGEGFTVWGVKIDTPESARNTDAINAEQARNITVTESFIRTGEDAIAIKAGDGPTTSVSITRNHFYGGHGMSIGGETVGGVNGIRVQDLSLDGPENGIRIRSTSGHGGAVEDVTYEDICIRNAKNPILFDTAYTFPGRGVRPIPVYSDITLRNVRISGGGRLQFNGFDGTHRIGVRLDGVVALDKPDTYHAQANHTDLTYGASPMNFVFTGDDATVTGKPVPGKLPACNTKFVPFP
jgi:polygalacturonase